MKPGSKYLLTGTALGLLFMTACADSRSAETPTGVSSTLTRSSSPSAQAAVEELGRAVALALRDEGLRQRVKNDMRRSAFREHKLDFTTYLRGSGGILLAKMSKETGRSREDLLGLIASVPRLEFYMPVAEHRERWRGGEDLIVAVLLEEEDAPVGFALSGERTALDHDTPPRTATLVLVPVETDFSNPLDLSRATNRNDQNGESIGTLVIEPPPGECLDCPGGEGSYPPPPPPPPGIYFTALTVWDDNEGWPLGEPEVEVHLRGLKKGVVRNTQQAFPFPPHSPVPYGSPNLPNVSSQGGRAVPYLPSTQFYPDEYQWVFADCAGTRAASPRKFNFDGDQGDTFTGNVLFAGQEKFSITEFIQTTTPVQTFRRVVPLLPPFEIYVVERDDDRECPKAERKFYFDADVEINLAAGNIADIFTIKNLDDEDILYLLGANNDPMGRWWINSYEQLEALNGTWLPRRTDVGEIDDVIIRLTNRGFSQTQLPPQTDFGF